MIVIACGGRNFTDRDLVYKTLTNLYSETPSGIQLLMHGGCEIFDRDQNDWVSSGADWIANDWAIENKVRRSVHSAKRLFKQYGKVGGRIRNLEMGMYALGIRKGHNMFNSHESLMPIVCVAFKGGTGTNHMCEVAEEFGFRLIKTWEK